MDKDALNIYLNDHLAGATLGSDHARQLADMLADTPFGPEMDRIAREIEEDREVLIELMDRLDATRNAIKQAGAWVAEKAGRVKFSGLSSADPELGRYMALETMSLGVEGKLSLWTALDRVSREHRELRETDLAGLIARAVAQRQALEAQRLTMAEAAFGATTAKA